MAGLASLLDAASFIAETFSDWGADGVPLIAKGDHAQAYRQWPVHPDDVPLLGGQGCHLFPELAVTLAFSFTLLACTGSGSGPAPLVSLF